MKSINLHILLCWLLINFNITELIAETIELDELQFHESFVENIKISGSVRAGVMYASNSLWVMPGSLYIAIGKKTNEMLCVQILSVDGHYGADIVYQLTGSNDGYIQFKLPTKYQDTITRYPPDQIAVLAEIKPACNGMNGRIVPASWGEPNVNVVKVYLNTSTSKTSLKLYTKNKGGKRKSEKIDCYPVKSKRNTAFDTECSIKNIGNFNLYKTKVLRSNFGNISKPIKLKIYIP